jgi:hypothetical protein
VNFVGTGARLGHSPPATAATANEGTLIVILPAALVRSTPPKARQCTRTLTLPSPHGTHFTATSDGHGGTDVFLLFA